MKEQIEVKGPITIEQTSEPVLYSFIITDAEDTRHFFLEKDGELVYDGYDKLCDRETAPAHL